MDLENKLGICIKTLDKKVTYQNEICIKICGVKISENCHKGCMENYDTKSPKIINEGMNLIKCQNVDGSITDATVVNDGKNLITILYPLIDKINSIDQNLINLKKHGLTKAELDILSLVLKGMSNKEISQKLFIANSTLKTHLNNIYKKLPSEWQSLKNRS